MNAELKRRGAITELSIFTVFSALIRAFFKLELVLHLNRYVRGRNMSAQIVKGQSTALSIQHREELFQRSAAIPVAAEIPVAAAIPIVSQHN